MSFLGQLMRPDATALRRRRFSPDTHRFQLYKQAQATLNSGLDLNLVVLKPINESLDDWLAVHVVDFYNRLQLLFATIEDVCSRTTCPSMSGGNRYEYLWVDGITYKRPTSLPAKQYMSLLFNWVQSQLNNEQIFPPDTSSNFPNDFKSKCSKIFSRLFRVFVHVYIHHFDRMLELRAEAHVNALFKHFVIFVRNFGLIGDKELEPLQHLVAKLCPS